MRTKTRLIASSVFPLLLVAQRVTAQCIMPGSIDEEYANATAVFVGTVATINYLPNTECCHVYSGTVTFDVERWWKGAGGKQITIGVYGYLFAADKHYAVFAMGSPPAATACNRAKLVSESAETLRWLNQRTSLVAEAWSAANQAVTRLPPEALKELPPAVRVELTRRGCTIPQADFEPMRNVSHGNFLGSGSDWAVLCSRHLTSSILVFTRGHADRVLELASRPDADFLQGSSGGRIAFSRGIRAASPAMIRQLQQDFDGKGGRPLAHAGIEDMFLGKASVVWYWRGGKWVVVGGADRP